jgi:murein endopeptidase
MENEGYYAWEPTRSLEKSGTSLSIQLVDDVTGQRQIFKQLRVFYGYDCEDHIHLNAQHGSWADE